MTTHRNLTPNDAVFVQLPPADANIPSPPAGFTPVKGGFARALKPHASELVSLPGAIAELHAFATYAETLGKTVPALSEVLASFEAARQWSSMRVKSRAWDKYSANEEGVAWVAVRTIMERLQPAFELATKGDPSLASRYPKLGALLGAKKTVASKSASTKRANHKAEAEGKPPIHGVVGKKRLRAEEKAALEAAKAAGNPPPEVQPPAVVVVKAEPPPAATPAVTNGASNGIARA